MYRHFVYLVNLLCISILREKYAKLLTRTSIKDNIYYEGIVSIPIVLKCGLHVLSGLIPSIAPTVLFC
jgi:hypothetical protein